MRAKTVLYERLINTGNFTHEKYGIEIELSSTDKAEDAMKEAKKFIERQLNFPTPQDRKTAFTVTKFDNDDIPF